MCASNGSKELYKYQYKHIYSTEMALVNKPYTYGLLEAARTIVLSHIL